MKKTITILSILILFSCGARKSEKKLIQESLKTETTDLSKIDKTENLESNIKKSEVKTENKEEQTTTVKKIVEPIDPTKPASFIDEKGNKKELNNAKETTETTTKNNNKKSETKIDTEEKLNTSKKESVKNKKKSKVEIAKKYEQINIDRQAWSLWNLLWLIPIVLSYLGWKNWSKITAKIWWI